MAKNPKILENVYSIRDIQIFGAGVEGPILSGG